jgi:hypothetical protein
MTPPRSAPISPGTGRRQFLADLGMGFTGLVLGTLLFEDGVARGLSPMEAGTLSAKSPKAKSVIWLFMVGGASHLETFDPKPALKRFANMTIAETPHANILQAPQLVNPGKKLKNFAHMETTLLRPQVGFHKRGQSGIEVCDWLPHVGKCIDDIAVVRSFWTTDFSHAAQVLFNTGRMSIDARSPSLGSWAHYGLGTLNEELPKFVVMGRPPSDLGGGSASHEASYLGPEHDGVPLEVDPARAVPYPAHGPEQYRETQQAEFKLVGRLNRLAAAEYPSDPALMARIKSYELAFRMQATLPEIVNLGSESEETRRLYGLDDTVTRPFGHQCLIARRLVE